MLLGTCAWPADDATLSGVALLLLLFLSIWIVAISGVQQVSSSTAPSIFRSLHVPDEACCTGLKASNIILGCI